jgi:ribosomal RNA-processing protein 9
MSTSSAENFLREFVFYDLYIYLMPDPFFSTSKHRKRKREDSSTKAGPSNAKKIARKSFGNVTRKTKKAKHVDEELSDGSDDGLEGIDDIDLRGDAGDDAEGSGEEDKDETPAEKRLRLAKLYLESVKEGLGKF